MSKRVNTSKIRPGQLIKVSETYVNDDYPDPEYKNVETYVWIGRVTKVDRTDGEEAVHLRRGGPYTDDILSDDGTTRFEILDDAVFNMQPGYYRYHHATTGAIAIVHFDGTNFGHSDRSPHQNAVTYFGFDPIRADTLFERIIQS